MLLEFVSQYSQPQSTAVNNASLVKKYVGIFSVREGFAFAAHITRIANPHLDQIVIKGYRFTAKFAADKRFWTVLCNPIFNFGASF